MLESFLRVDSHISGLKTQPLLIYPTHLKKYIKDVVAGGLLSLKDLGTPNNARGQNCVKMNSQYSLRTENIVNNLSKIHRGLHKSFYSCILQTKKQTKRLSDTNS